MAAASSWRVAGAGVPVLSLPPWLRSLEGPRRWLSLPWFEARTPHLWINLFGNCAPKRPWKIEHFPDGLDT